MYIVGRSSKRWGGLTTKDVDTVAIFATSIRGYRDLIDQLPVAGWPALLETRSISRMASVTGDLRDRKGGDNVPLSPSTARRRYPSGQSKDTGSTSGGQVFKTWSCHLD
ncbi:hypothetical protein L917_00182 [Phytophthora nicotianae]|uniref:Uncharacterized protein n=1 Tax=Phytophthora nicotianae TaxID=4792 RepID=W2M476_PHYNI|nr:hypothetical protein L917_00182 [Phytophthora nicotianae]